MSKKPKDFDNEISVIAKYGEQSLEQLERHAKINAGFHDYEEDSFADKQMIGNLCVQYKVFFEGDPKFSSFLNEMKEYSEPGGAEYHKGCGYQFSRIHCKALATMKPKVQGRTL